MWIGSIIYCEDWNRKCRIDDCWLEWLVNFNFRWRSDCTSDCVMRSGVKCMSFRMIRQNCFVVEILKIVEICFCVLFSLFFGVTHTWWCFCKHFNHFWNFLAFKIIHLRSKWSEMVCFIIYRTFIAIISCFVSRSFLRNNQKFIIWPFVTFAYKKSFCCESAILSQLVIFFSCNRQKSSCTPHQ